MKRHLVLCRFLVDIGGCLRTNIRVDVVQVNPLQEDETHVVLSLVKLIRYSILGG